MPVRLTISDPDRGPIERNLIGIFNRASDLGPLGVRIEKAMITANTDGAVTGRDRKGNRYEKLSPNTIRRGRGGLGPPLAPKFWSSRVVDKFRAETLQTGPTEITVRGHWPGLDWLGYHVTGTGYMPIRDPVGVRPNLRRTLARVMDEWVKFVLGGGESWEPVGRKGPYPAPPTLASATSVGGSLSDTSMA